MTISDEDWKIVESRLKSMAETFEVGFLSEIFNKAALLKEVRNRTKVGEHYANMQLSFVKWLLKQSAII